MDHVEHQAHHLTHHRHQLTPPPDSPRLATPSLKNKLRGQDQCRLLTELPVDIRLMIWESAIGGLHLHIYNRLRRDKLGHQICNDDDGKCEICFKLFYVGSRGVHHAESSLMPLLRTCRQM